MDRTETISSYAQWAYPAVHQDSAVIVTETPDAFRFITQPDHAQLASQFARHWGRKDFEIPSPFKSVVLAAEIHDDGWFQYDRRPRLTVDGSPENFTELDGSTWIDIYERGIAHAVETDRYAGLLVSMHGTGLRRRQYGLSPSWPDTPQAFREFVAREESRQRELLSSMVNDAGKDHISEADERFLADLHETGTGPEESDSLLWRNYRFLQSWDTLSLACCTTPSPPGRHVIGNVPKTPGEGSISLTLGTADDNVITVDPYPFTSEALPIRVPIRVVDKSEFSTADGLLDAYYAQGREDLAYTLRPSE